MGDAVVRPSQLGDLRARLVGAQQGLECATAEASRLEANPAVDREGLKSLVDDTVRALEVPPHLDTLCACTVAKQLRLVSGPESEWAVLEALQQLLSHRRLNFDTFVRPARPSRSKPEIWGASQ